MTEPTATRRTGIVLVGLLALVIGVSCTSFAEDGDVQRATRLLQQGSVDQAIEMLESVTRRNPDDAMAWFTLASARHRQGDWDGAVQANERAAAFPRTAATARYNQACALALLGRLDDAERALRQAEEAGFDDPDLLATDPDLAALRERGSIDLPPASKYEDFRGQNGVEMQFAVLLPEGYDPKREYPAMVVFPPGSGGPRALDWMMRELFADRAAPAGWIVVSPTAPERGWMTHPTHHALEDLFDEVKSRHRIQDGSFDLVGFGGGGRPAATYALMSGGYFRSLTVFSSRAWERWDEDELGSFRRIPVHLVVGADDAYGRELNTRVRDRMKREGVDVRLTVLDGNDATLPTVQRAGLVPYVPKKNTGG